jgi:hypothetical protein
VAFFSFSLLPPSSTHSRGYGVPRSCYFQPFTGVLRKIFGSLTREVWEFLLTPAFAASFAKATASQGGYGVAGHGLRAFAGQLRRAGSGSHQSVFKQRKGSEGLPQSDHVGIIFAFFVIFC